MYQLLPARSLVKLLAANTTECISERRSGQFKHTLFFIAKLEVSQGWTQKNEKKKEQEKRKTTICLIHCKLWIYQDDGRMTNELS